MVFLSEPPLVRPDRALSAVSDARGLPSGGGIVVWAERVDDRWRLVVRSSRGELTRPGIRTFAAPPEAEVGTLQGGAVVITYSRCAGRSLTRGCDVFALRDGREIRVPGLSRSDVSETSPDAFGGRWAYASRGGPKPGLWVREANGAAKRLTTSIPSDVSLFGQVVAYVVGQDVLLRRTAGPTTTPLVRRAPGAPPQSVSMSTYRAFWREGERLFTSQRQDSGDRLAALPGRSVPGLRAVAVGARATPLLLTRDAVLRAGSSGAFG